MNGQEKGTDDAPWFIPALVLKLADGSTLVKPGKAIQRAQANKTAKMTGLSTQTLRRLAETGFIRKQCPTPAITYYFPAEIEAFLDETEADPDYWNHVRKQAFLSSKELTRDRERKLQNSNLKSQIPNPHED